MNIIRKFLGFFSGSESGPHVADAPAEPVIVPRGEHKVSRKNIDADALKVLNRLNRFKHDAYLVGGGVRDLLLQRPVKDFDIATSAHPNEVKKLFRNCRLIGRRFRLAHILFRGAKVIEVSTFRRHAGFNDEGELLIKSDNTFGTAEEDARRRDFTVNGLFYNIADFSVIDYVGGLKDLDSKVIATIGDPAIRFQEDPIRMLRAIRFAARLDFTFAPPTRSALERHRQDIWKGAVPRILDETLRMLQQGAAARSFAFLRDLKVLDVILPRLALDMEDEEVRSQVERILHTLDGMTLPKKGLSPSLLIALLYFPGFNAALRRQEGGVDRLRFAADYLEGDLTKLQFPKLQFERARQLLAAQHRIEQIGKKKSRPSQLVRKAYFEDALFLFENTRPRSKENRSLLRRWKTLHEKLLAEGGVPAAEEKPSRRRRSSRGRGRRRPPQGLPPESPPRSPEGAP